MPPRVPLRCLDSPSCAILDLQEVTNQLDLSRYMSKRNEDEQKSVVDVESSVEVEVGPKECGKSQVDLRRLGLEGPKLGKGSDGV